MGSISKGFGGVPVGFPLWDPPNPPKTRKNVESASLGLKSLKKWPKKPKKRPENTTFWNFFSKKLKNRGPGPAPGPHLPKKLKKFAKKLKNRVFRAKLSKKSIFWTKNQFSAKTPTVSPYSCTQKTPKNWKKWPQNTLKPPIFQFFLKKLIGNPRRFGRWRKKVKKSEKKLKNHVFGAKISKKQVFGWKNTTFRANRKWDTLQTVMKSCKRSHGSKSRYPGLNIKPSFLILREQ